jgi:H+-transporting ATPase
MVAGSALATCLLVLSFAVFFVAHSWLGLHLAQLQSLIFLMLVFSGQGTVYLVRERGPYWRSRPGRWLLLATLADIVIVSALAAFGILMAPIPPALIGGLLLLLMGYLTLLDFVKVPLFRRLGLR